jgi:hypothetical protein
MSSRATACTALILILFLAEHTRAKAAIAASSAEVGKGGRVVLRLRADEAGTPPWIAGDFTDWNPVPMQRHRNEWRFLVNLSRGVYRFSFRTSDGRWFVPKGFPNRTEDQMGGWVGVLVVP